jgi:hypothetical protein
METHKYDWNVAAGLLIVACLISQAPAGYDVSDLSGTWSVHGAVSGADPNVAGVFYMTGTGNSSGLITGTNYADSQGVGEATWASNSGSFALSGGGVLSLDGDDAAFRGAMNWEEDLVVSVGTLTPGPDTGLAGYNLWVWVRQSLTPAFTIADGAGTWWLHGLFSASDWGSWSHGQLQVDAAGNFSFVDGTWALSDDPGAHTPEDGSISITGYGVVGFSFDPNVHGIMNLDKDLIVFAMPEGNGGGLNIMQKRSGATFSMSDLAGTWYGNGLCAANADHWNSWYHAIIEADAGGAVSGSILLDSDGELGGFNDTLAIDADGIVTIVSDPNSHGTMSDDKNLIVFTMDNGEDGAELLILTRAVVSPIYRFWSPLHSRHFYTISTAEKNAAQATYPPSVWTYEGQAYYGFPRSGELGLAPVYRFWSPLNSAHFYTISADERDSVIATYPESTWTYEGTAFYAYPKDDQPVDASPIYRFWSPLHSTHFYTISEAEKDAVIATYPSSVWAYEGIAWYAYE